MNFFLWRSETNTIFILVWFPLKRKMMRQFQAECLFWEKFFPLDSYGFFFAHSEESRAITLPRINLSIILLLLFCTRKYQLVYSFVLFSFSLNPSTAWRQSHINLIANIKQYVADTEICNNECHNISMLLEYIFKIHASHKNVLGKLAGSIEPK